MIKGLAGLLRRLGSLVTLWHHLSPNPSLGGGVDRLGRLWWTGRNRCPVAYRSIKHWPDHGACVMRGRVGTRSVTNYNSHYV